MKESISKFMAYVHMSVNQTSKEYLTNERRYNYTTPKSFLEQIKLYHSLLGQRSKDLTTKMERLENGLQKLNSTSTQVINIHKQAATKYFSLPQAPMFPHFNGTVSWTAFDPQQMDTTFVLQFLFIWH